MEVQVRSLTGKTAGRWRASFLLCRRDVRFCAVRLFREPVDSQGSFGQQRLSEGPVLWKRVHFNLVLYSNYIWMCVIPLMNTEIFSKYCFSDGMGKGELYSILIFSRNRMSVPRKEEVGEGYKIIGNLSSLNLRIQCQKSFFFLDSRKFCVTKIFPRLREWFP